MHLCTLATAALLVSLSGGCGSAGVETTPMVHLSPMPGDSEVYLFVMDDRPPVCPWEVIGTVQADSGWSARAADREAVAEAVRDMGGQGVLLPSRDAAEGDVVRFLDPVRLCDPEGGSQEPGLLEEGRPGTSAT